MAWHNMFLVNKCEGSKPISEHSFGDFLVQMILWMAFPLQVTEVAIGIAIAPPSLEVSFCPADP